MSRQNHEKDEREAAFLKAYLADPTRNGTQAAIKAGYAKAGARVQACRMLTRPNIRAAIDAADQRTAASIAQAVDRYAVTKERIIATLARMAFSDIRDVVSFGPEHRTITTMTGEQFKTSGVGIKASDEISDDAAISIAEVSEGKDGIKVKLVDRRAALLDLAKVTGILKDDEAKPLDGLEILGALIAGMKRSALPIGMGQQQIERGDLIEAHAIPSAGAVDDEEDPEP